ncbi:hypothetical protein GBF35_25675 [Nonomuraea phyllanthi]|uniref:hypothetical protein n=1 Tax=Nonomuraea phyllanthi TaxID=2219224 RepID=UPI001292F438|nr:hypothetical protein [Nonomuraea phyllanthi]QFY09590.1 hypothetical protein GBF35_25675 [Nonomuraea phyllanthi]
MLRTKRALIASLATAVFGWIAAGAATAYVVLNPNLHHIPTYLLWLHSFAIVATVSTMLLVALRAFERMVGDAAQAFAVGLETGIDIRDSMTMPADCTPSSPGTQEAPATTGASRS